MLPTTNAVIKAVSNPFEPMNSLAKPPSKASLLKIRKPQMAQIIVEILLIWLFAGISRFKVSVKCFVVVAATAIAKIPIE